SIPTNHKLHFLFTTLASQRQAAITTEFDKLITNDDVAQEAAKQWGMDLSLNGVLTISDRAFEQWRYAYEGNVTSGAANGLQQVCIASKATILGIRPDWQAMVNSLGALPTFQAR